jgi:hypothetical protein
LRIATFSDLKPPPTGVVSDAISLDRVQRVLRQQFPRLLLGCHAGELKIVRQPRADGVEHAEGGVHDFGADAVAPDDGDLLRHAAFPVVIKRLNVNRPL